MTAALRKHIAKLPESTKNRLLLAVAHGEHAAVLAELDRVTGDDRRNDREPRTVVALLDRADELRKHPTGGAAVRSPMTSDRIHTE